MPASPQLAKSNDGLQPRTKLIPALRHLHLLSLQLVKHSLSNLPSDFNVQSCLFNIQADRHILTLDSKFLFPGVTPTVTHQTLRIHHYPNLQRPHLRLRSQAPPTCLLFSNSFSLPKPICLSSRSALDPE